ncbi:fibronectin type III domain-containing protein [Flavobacterium sp. N1994]|uniref:fibronectin type III domain-containing protein n=1 Tax=Flavobacterium sp. N1994 TaxID=2986827 RepID=UPI002222EFDE|nr:fibronectin type III domain-containing protein [Flavobacterium sp. N1994]
MKKFTLQLLFLFISISGYSQLALEGFENTTGPVAGPLPTTWALGTGTWSVFEKNTPTNVGSGQSWGLNPTGSTTVLPYQGTNCAYVNREQINQGSTSEDYLSTPSVLIPTNGELHFFTRMFTSGDQGTIYQIKVAPATATPSDPAAYTTLVQQWTEADLIIPVTNFNVYTEKIVDLSAFAGQNVYVTFVKIITQPTTITAGDRWLVDNVSINSKCLVPSPTATTGITQNGASLNWANPSGATSWEIEIVQGTGAPTGTGTIYNGTLPYIVTGLLPNTTYKYYVRALCSTGYTSEWSAASTPFTTGTAPPVCGGNFVDAGGAANPYAANSNVTTTICPTNPGDVVTVTFTAFNTEATWDALYVYNGNAVVPANLIPSSNGAGNVPGGLAGGYWGTTIPCPFTSSDANGCLTFVFRSDGSGQRDGWIANITCAPPPPCRTPTAIASSALTFNSVTLNWTQPANPDTSVASAWQVLALPCGSPAPTAAATGFIDVTTPPPYNLTGLTPATCYDIYVRANCGSATSAWPCTPKTITTLAAPPICGGNFVDAGGTTNAYAANSNVTTTICPTNPGDVVTVTFTSFDTEATWDALYVYNGNAVVPANLIPSNNGAGNVPGGLAGGYWGTTIPCPFTSSAPNGCLTFVFRSDGSGQNAGWVSNITCGPPPPCRLPTAITTNTVTHNSVVLNWTQPVNPDTSVASAWQVLALPCGSAAPTAAATGYIDVTTPPPYTLTGLNPTTCYDIYVRANCGSATSAWPCTPKTITTLIAPPVCGGTFVDAGGTTNPYAANSNITTTICPTNTGDVVTVTFTLFDTEATWDGLYVYDGNTVNPATLLPSTNGAGNVPGGLAGSYWGTLTGGALPGPFTATNPSGCLTFVFRSDGFGQNGGWNSTVNCAPPPTCLKPNTLTTSNITATSALLGWSDTNIVPASQWEVLVLPFGSPAPLPTATGIIVSSNPALITGLNPATKYTFYVRAVCSSTDHSAWSAGKDFLTLIINDECAGAIFAPVNSSSVCQQITSGTVAGATASAGAVAPCLGTADDDSWFQFVATNPFLTVSLLNVQGSTTNLNFAVYSGSCGALTRIFCSTANNLTGVVNALTIGQTYYIRVYSNANTPQTSTFDLCISTPASCISSQSACQNLSYQNTTGITSQGTIGCLSSSPNPTYYTINIQQSGPINLLLTQSTTQGGTPNLDVDYAAWGPFTDTATACAAIGNPPTLAPGIGVPISLTTGCSFSAASIENLNIVNAIAGQVYVILITNYSDDPGYVSLTQTNSTDPGAGVYFCCPNAYFTYSPVSYCKQAGTSNPIAVITAGSQAGVFSSTLNPGLVFVNTATGEVDLAASAPGNYLITNTVAASGSCLAKSQSYSISIVEPTAATISYSAPSYCQSITTLQTVTQTGTPGGTYSATPSIGLSINPTTGDINPSLSSPGIYTVKYGIPGSVCTTGDPTTQVEILALPTIVQPLPVAACYSYTLPALAVGNYFSQTGGVGSIDPTVPLTSSQTVFIYAEGANGCINEKSFQVTINSVPTPTFSTPTLSACTTPTGSVTVLSPIGTTGSTPGDLFISQVTDATTGSLTYVEIYNGTGAPVNLSNYKLRTFNNGSSTVTTVCDNTLSGIVNNNSTFVVAVGGNTNAPGVVPNQTFAGCTGVNQDDCIKLTTLSNTVIDVWGRTDGVAFTPLNQSGYSYSRLASSTHPSTTFNPADWTVVDWTATTEDYSGVGIYSLATSNYQYSIDNGVTFQAGLTFNNLAAGNHILIVKDLVTGCLSAPVNVLIDAINATPSVTTFTYTTPICQNATANPLPDTSATGFTIGGLFSSNPIAGIDINPTTGEINLANTTAGTYDITYTFAFNPTTCQSYSTTTFTVVITNVITPVLGFSYTSPICQNAQATLSPTLDAGFTTGGTFGSTTGLTIDTTTGVIDLSTSTAGAYTVTYTVPGTSCLLATSATSNIVINPVITPITTFSYTTPVCQNATTNPIPDTSATGFTIGGTFSSNPATGIDINPTTGEINLVNTVAGTYVITYNVPLDATICQLASTSSFTIVINPIVNPILGFTYTTPICANAQATLSPTLVAGFTTGGTFASSTGLSIDGTTGVINLATSTPGPYTITYTSNPNAPTCLIGGTNTFNIVINPVITPVTGFSYSTPFCSNDSVNLQSPSLTTGFTTGGTYNSTTGLSIDSTTGVIDLANSTPGTYTITYAVPANTSTCQVASSNTAQVMIIPPVTIDLVGGCQSINYVLTANPTNSSFDPLTATYAWHDSNGALVGNTQSITVLTVGIYTVTVTVDGCSTQSPPFNVETVFCVIQKGISVNNDGLNDTFDLTGFGVKKLTIFNRLGMKVYTRDNYLNEWGGKSDNGDELPDGTYYYVIDRNNGETKTGWIYINRAQ